MKYLLGTCLVSELVRKKPDPKVVKWVADCDLHVRFGERILAITMDIAQTWGILQGEVEAKGIGIPTIDGLIGATAITHNLTVVTRNAADIVKTGAKILNPWDS